MFLKVKLFLGMMFRDGLEFFFEDLEMEGIIVIGEIGGEVEFRVVEVIIEYWRLMLIFKFIVVMVVGCIVLFGWIMGYVGVVFILWDVFVDVKVKVLEEVGVIIVLYFGIMGVKMKELLGR